MLVVFLRSEEHGYEEFEYETLPEALAAIGRLYDEIANLHDDVEREIGIKTEGIKKPYVCHACGLEYELTDREYEKNGTCPECGKELYGSEE